MDPQQPQPFHQPQSVPLPPAQGGPAPHDENPIQQQLLQSQFAPSPPPAPYSDPQAVDYARDKVAATPAAPAYPYSQPPQPTAPPEPPPAPPQEPAPAQPIASQPEPTVRQPHANFMPAQEFETFQLPPEEAEEPAVHEAVAPPAETQPAAEPEADKTPAPTAEPAQAEAAEPPAYQYPATPAAEPTPIPPEPPQPMPPETQALPATVAPAPTPIAPVIPPVAQLAAAPAMAATITQPGAPVAVRAPRPSPLDKLKAGVDRFYQGKAKLPSKIKPLAGAALTGVAIFLLFNSQALIGQIQYLTNAGTDTAAVSDAASSEVVGAEPVIVIPKINVNAPVVYDEPSFDEPAVQKALERGVVHYGSTALPGQVGNNVIVGHSSNNWWASGKYKFAFVLLEKLEVGDTFELHYNSKRFIYKVFDKKIVDPKDVSVLSQPTSEPITTLITCVPPGTSLHRLVVQAKQISPDPKSNQPAASAAPDTNTSLPGNTPSLWEQIRRRFSSDY